MSERLVIMVDDHDDVIGLASAIVMRLRATDGPVVLGARGVKPNVKNLKTSLLLAAAIGGRDVLDRLSIDHGTPQSEAEIYLDHAVSNAVREVVQVEASIWFHSLPTANLPNAEWSWPTQQETKP